jgi:hypothetical protein
MLIFGQPSPKRSNRSATAPDASTRGSRDPIGVHAQTGPQAPYTARAFTPAHGDLARSGGVPAQLANVEYVEALARVVYYWGYPAVDVMTRTSMKGFAANRDYEGFRR